MPGYKTITVVIEEEYLIPMATENVSQLDGKTAEQLGKEWFEDFDINRSHASREGYRLGGGRRVVTYAVSDFVPTKK